MATPNEIAPGIFALDRLKLGRAYLIEDDDGLTLVDTSSGGVARHIFDAIEHIGRKPEDLSTIVATHYHRDHTGNVAELVQRSGAALCAHAEDVPYIDGRLPWMKLRGMPSLSNGDGAHFTLRVDRALSEGDVLAAAGGIEVIHAPGHTPGHIALYAKARDVMFTGDAFMNVAGLHISPRISTHDMQQAKESVARLSTFAFDVALPCHGRPIIGRASEKLADWSRAWF
jgi:glyoxylase-like metal-dependent hydrolase (beta-lactamase superfamily II)